MTAQPIKLGVISSYVPKKCGVATFANNLLSSMLAGSPGSELFVIAAENGEELAYGPEVKAVLEASKKASYAVATEQLKAYRPAAVLLQHEFGLFGGKWSDFTVDGTKHHDPTGSYLLDVVEPLRVPLITTLHTVIKDLDPGRQAALAAIIDSSSRVVVMSEGSAKIIRRQFPSARSKVAVIPHGVMVRQAREPKSVILKRLNLQPQRFYLTVTGLIGPNKNIEMILEALPKIIAEHPEVHLLVVGQTHPQILKQTNETYRRQLEQMARDLGVDGHVTFVNEYLSAAALLDYLAITDVYLTIHHDPQQAASGTLANAIGNGLVCISTPYPYAKELLADGRGVLVPFNDSPAIMRAVNRLIKDKDAFRQIQRQATAYGRPMAWDRVGQAYWQLINSAKDE